MLIDAATIERMAINHFFHRIAKNFVSADAIVQWSRNAGNNSFRERVAQYLLMVMYGFSLPPEVVVGKNVAFKHNGIATVILPKTVIKDNVTIYHNVTLGNAHVDRIGFSPQAQVSVDNDKHHQGAVIIIEEGAVICAGAKVLRKEGTLVVRRGSVVAANAVLLESTGENEVWGGVPARKLGSLPSV